MTNPILTAVSALAAVEQVKAWNDRHYINLNAARGSRANADLRTKLWIKGAVLTIEAGKGYHSTEYLAEREALEAAVVAAGAPSAASDTQNAGGMTRRRPVMAYPSAYEPMFRSNTPRAGRQASGA